jgi:hypothetical protein
VHLITISYVVGVTIGFATIIGGGVRYTIKFIVWVSRMLVLWEAVAQQFQPNHGSSLVDRFERLEAEVGRISASLAGDELASRRTQEPA